MKKYKLIKELPTFKAGDIFTIGPDGSLYKDIGEPRPICAYAASTLKKFPNILTEWFEEISERPKTVWDLKEGDEFWAIEGTDVISMHYWDGFEYHRSLREYGNAFLSRQEAEKELASRKAKQILLRDTKGFKPDKNNDYESYQVYWDGVCPEDQFDVSRNYGIDGTLAFATREDAEVSMQIHEKEWKIYLGVEE